MNKLIPLMQREWLQHRFGWALMVAIPVALALLLTTFGRIQISADNAAEVGEFLPALLAMGAMAGSMAVIFIVAALSSIVIVAGLARRDHADRSVEFWLSMPTTHSASFAAPLIVHLLLVPAAALLIGLAGGWLLSVVLVSRVAGFGAWLALPWAEVLMATLSGALRFIGGLPLAVLWLLPVILLTVLLAAWFRRWGWVILAAGLGLGSQLLSRVFGQPLLSDWFAAMFKHAAVSMVGASGVPFQMDKGHDPIQALQAFPGWLLGDFGSALAGMASPLMALGLLVSAGCFALLVDWRRRGASAAG